MTIRTIRWHRVGDHLERVPIPEAPTTADECAHEMAAALATMDDLDATLAKMQGFLAHLQQDMQRHRRLWEGRHGGGSHEAPWVREARGVGVRQRPWRPGWHGSRSEATLLRS